MSEAFENFLLHIGSSIDHFDRTDPFAEQDFHYHPDMLPLVRKAYDGAMGGDPEAATSLCFLMQGHRTHIAFQFYILLQCGKVSRKLYTAVFRDVFMDGKIAGVFRQAGYRTSELVWMFDATSRELMTDDEWKHFEQLPDLIPIFRGAAGKSRTSIRHRLSWTTDLKTAEFFADQHQRFYRPTQDAQVWSGFVKKVDVLAYFGDRNEHEIVIRPPRVSKVQCVSSWTGRAAA